MQNQWVEFFFGSPRRAIGTAITLLIMGMVVNPAFRTQVLTEVANVLVGVLQLAIMAAIGVAIWNYLTKSSHK